MFLNLDQYVTKDKIKDLDDYLSKISFNDYKTQEFSFLDKQGINNLLGGGINLSEINHNIVNDLIKKNPSLTYKQIVGKGYFAPNKFHYIWQKNHNWRKLPKLAKFIDDLGLFEYTTRIVIIFNKAGKSGIEHRDHGDKNRIDEFIWIRTNNKKIFYIKNLKGQKHYVNCNIIWFDSRFRHNSSPSNQDSYSIRIDGKFKPHIRKFIARNAIFRYPPYHNLLIKQK